MRRREFVTLLGGAAASWPLKARAQEAQRIRRIGVLMALSESDRGAKALLDEFKRGLAESGWTDGGNILMDVRWTGGDVDLMHKFAKELVTLNPDVILANSTPVTLALQRTSIRRLLPSVHPMFRSASRNAANQDCASRSLSA